MTEGVQPKTHSRWLSEGWTEEEIVVFSKIGLVLADPPCGPPGTGNYLTLEQEYVVGAALQFFSVRANIPEDQKKLAGDLSSALGSDTWLIMTTIEPQEEA